MTVISLLIAQYMCGTLFPTALILPLLSVVLKVDEISFYCRFIVFNVYQFLCLIHCIIKRFSVG